MYIISVTFYVLKKEYTFMAESDSGWRCNEYIKRNKNGGTYYVGSNHR